MYDVYLCLTTQHDWRLVLVAGAVCLVACASTFLLYARLPSEDSGRRLAWLVMLGLVAGSGVWTTHFVGMLAFRTGFEERYDSLGAVASLLSVVAASTLGFGLASRASGPRPIRLRLAGGLVVGMGVALMHYLGMAAYRTTGDLVWRPERIFDSIVIGAVFSSIALSIAWPGCERRRSLLAAGLLGLGICGLHFTGMAAFAILPDPARILPAPSMSNDVMAVAAVAMTGVVLIGAGSSTMVDYFSHRRELRRLRDAMDAMTDAMAFYDNADRLVAWNSGFGKVHHGKLYRGQPYGEIVRAGLVAGRFLEASVDPESWLAQRMTIRRHGGTFDVRNPDGRWLRCNERRTAEGGAVTVYTDITDLKRAEETMGQARDLAQEANRIKSEFLANMSHEIRTPMNGILGMNALMLMTGLSSAQKRYAEVIQSSAEGLMTMFNDILDVARLEAGAVAMARAEFDIGELLLGVAAQARSEAEAKGLALLVEPGQGERLVGDAGRIRQVLAHLVGNAVKFTDQGEIRLDLWRWKLDDGRTRFRVDVIDTGPGVPAELKPVLFEPFRQVDGSTTRRHGGAGLGLAICRHAAQLMGGSVGVWDRREGGSIFWLELTLPTAATQPGAVAQSAGSQAPNASQAIADQTAADQAAA
ncbi:MAG TPA: MHYT domain-containing protein [Caulobacteraceae bacterium]|jgi:signal transduction histidine kinase/NO-binding membrane sensor protein with MHYT domain